MTNNNFPTVFLKIPVFLENFPENSQNDIHILFFFISLKVTFNCNGEINIFVSKIGLQTAETIVLKTVKR